MIRGEDCVDRVLFVLDLHCYMGDNEERFGGISRWWSWWTWKLSHRRNEGRTLGESNRRVATEQSAGNGGYKERVGRGREGGGVLVEVELVELEVEVEVLLELEVEVEVEVDSLLFTYGLVRARQPRRGIRSRNIVAPDHETVGCRSRDVASTVTFDVPTDFVAIVVIVVVVVVVVVVLLLLIVAFLVLPRKERLRDTRLQPSSSTIISKVRKRTNARRHAGGNRIEIREQEGERNKDESHQYTGQSGFLSSSRTVLERLKEESVNDSQLVMLSERAHYDHSLSGYLHKRTADSAKWQLRWFVLYQNMLFYYENETCSRPSGVVLLEGCYCDRLITAKGKEPDKQICKLVVMNIFVKNTFAIRISTGVKETWNRKKSAINQRGTKKNVEKKQDEIITRADFTSTK
ncbi:ras-specific guanine nucleotide-releasing factor 2-like isoform X1 [Vespula squamosa]|uniref:Ras-specific guanine nucleotide-releasing factor 2-like isoform X1 n=1 Tax=Vespula squamosa TaxID=30214 RepID=A0ABD2AFG3_VESSQ